MNFSFVAFLWFGLPGQLLIGKKARKTSPPPQKKGVFVPAEPLKSVSRRSQPRPISGPMSKAFFCFPETVCTGAGPI